MKKVIMFLFLLSEVVQADWFRVQISAPIVRKPYLVVCSYSHRMGIDLAIPNSLISLFLTVIYDLTKNPSVIYSKVSRDLNESCATHFQAEELLLVSMSAERELSPPVLARTMTVRNPHGDGPHLNESMSDDLLSFESQELGRSIPEDL